MRRLFGPSVVLLVMSVMMMVGSWFRVGFAAVGGMLVVDLTGGQVCIYLPYSPSGTASFWADATPNFAWPMLPSFISHIFVGGSCILVPSWYFVILSAALVAILWTARSRARSTASPSTCPACGYDLSGGQSVCPECGRAKAAAGASATLSQ